VEYLTPSGGREAGRKEGSLGNLPSEILWHESDRPRKSQQKVHGNGDEVPLRAAKRSFLSELKLAVSLVPLDEPPVHGDVPEELVAGGTDECKDPIRILLDSSSEQTEGEDDDGRGVLQSIEVMWPPVASLHRATEALHQPDPEGSESEEGNEDVAVEGRMLPSGSVDGFSSSDMVGDPPVDGQEEIDEREAQVAEDTDKGSEEITWLL
jgi:hypothetical protein